MRAGACAIVCRPWGSLGPFDVNTASPALLEAMGMTAERPRRLSRAASRSLLEIRRRRGPLPPRIAPYNGFTIYTLRASARLRRPDGTYSEVVRTAGSHYQII